MRRKRLRPIPIVTVLFFLTSCALLAAFGLPHSPNAVLSAAEQRWEGRGFANYRIVVQVERSGVACTQELEVRGNRQPFAVRDTCGSSWFSQLSVPRLFDYSTRVAQAPTCYPSSQLCPCQQLRVGRVVYDPQLGYPSLIDYERRVRPNIISLDYWRRAWDQRKLPNCDPGTRNIRITVLSLKPVS